MLKWFNITYLITFSYKNKFPIHIQCNWNTEIKKILRKQTHYENSRVRNLQTLFQQRYSSRSRLADVHIQVTFHMRNFQIYYPVHWTTSASHVLNMTTRQLVPQISRPKLALSEDKRTAEWQVVTVFHPLFVFDGNFEVCIRNVRGFSLVDWQEPEKIFEDFLYTPF